MPIYYHDGSNSNSGRIIQVKTASNDSNQYWANATDWTNISGLSISITPKESTSILLMRAQVKFATAHSGDCVASLAIKKDGSLLSYTTNASWGYGDYHEYVSDNDNSLSSGTGQCERVEVAGTTSATQFDVCIRTGASGWSSNNVYVGRSNRGENGWYNSSNVRSTFSITEVAA